jgi:hypothetical protein
MVHDQRLTTQPTDRAVLMLEQSAPIVLLSKWRTKPFTGLQPDRLVIVHDAVHDTIGFDAAACTFVTPKLLDFDASIAMALSIYSWAGRKIAGTKFLAEAGCWC